MGDNLKKNYDVKEVGHTALVLMLHKDDNNKSFNLTSMLHKGYDKSYNLTSILLLTCWISAAALLLQSTECANIK